MKFYDTSFLKDEAITLRCDGVYRRDLFFDLPQSYEFTIMDNETGEEAGRCELRLGSGRKIYFAGNIGYRVHHDFRGRGYAARACRLMFRLAAMHNMKSLLITCNPDNAPSEKTILNVGGVLIDEAPVPEEFREYLMGDSFKKIFEVKLFP